MRIYIILLAQLVFTLALTAGDSGKAVMLAWLYVIFGACLNYAAHKYIQERR